MSLDHLCEFSQRGEVANSGEVSPERYFQKQQISGDIPRLLFRILFPRNRYPRTYSDLGENAVIQKARRISFVGEEVVIVWAKKCHYSCFMGIDVPEEQVEIINLDAIEHYIQKDINPALKGVNMDILYGEGGLDKGMEAIPLEPIYRALTLKEFNELDQRTILDKLTRFTEDHELHHRRFNKISHSYCEVTAHLAGAVSAPYFALLRCLDAWASDGYRLGDEYQNDLLIFYKLGFLVGKPLEFPDSSRSTIQERVKFFAKWLIDSGIIEKVTREDISAQARIVLEEEYSSHISRSSGKAT